VGCGLRLVFRSKLNQVKKCSEASSEGTLHYINNKLDLVAVLPKREKGKFPDSSAVLLSIGSRLQAYDTPLVSGTSIIKAYECT